ncbi:hypothetical protein HMN09_00768100 [Mycena chlorophos]|uniref:Uncharacterized protein n=1 Tax=Mycena chlorophos TaxID=658473 RepID=A0A8H6SVN3_MYCCL|nr:hypothetical protein HMN09_00768100 [Mycena chlorophos]
MEDTSTSSTSPPTPPEPAPAAEASSAAVAGVPIPVPIPLPTPSTTPPAATGQPATMTPVPIPVGISTIPTGTIPTSLVAGRPPLTITTPFPPQFYRSDTTFNPAPYTPLRNPGIYPTLSHPTIVPPPVPSTSSTIFEKPPTSGGPPFDGMLIHPPFTVLPDSVVLTEPMNYMVLHNHSVWFLDVRDYVTLDGAPPGAIRYPRELEPPRPRRQKDLLLRCTFCPRTYAGVNAKSMWTRHVREKHRVVLSKAWTEPAQARGRVSGASPASPTTSASPSTPAPRPTPLPVPTVQPPVPRLSLPTPNPPLTTTTPLPSTSSSGIPKIIVPPRPAVTSAAAAVAATPPVRGKPGPKPKPKPTPAASPVKSPAKPGARPRGRPPKFPRPVPAASAATTPTTRSTPTPDPEPEPDPEPSGWMRTDSPPPPEGILPPRMRPGARLSVKLSRPPAEDSPAATATGSNEDNESQTDHDVVADLLLMDVDESQVPAREDVAMSGVDGDVPSSSTPEETNKPVVEGDNDFDDGFSVDMDIEEEEEEDLGPTPLGATTFSLGSLAYLTNRDLAVTPPPVLPPIPPPPAASISDVQSSGVLTPGLLPTLFAASDDVLVLRTDKMDREMKRQLVGRLREFGVDVRGDEMDVDLDELGEDGWKGLPERAVGQMMSTPNGRGADVELSPELKEFGESWLKGTTASFRDALEGLTWPSVAGPSNASADLDPNTTTNSDATASSTSTDFSSMVASELAVPLRTALTDQLAEAILGVASTVVGEALEVASEEACVEWAWRGRVLESEREHRDHGQQSAECSSAEDVIQHPLHHLLAA